MMTMITTVVLQSVQYHACTSHAHSAVLVSQRNNNRTTTLENADRDRIINSVK